MLRDPELPHNARMTASTYAFHRSNCTRQNRHRIQARDSFGDGRNSGRKAQHTPTRYNARTFIRPYQPVKVRLRQISGAFSDGYALDKHTASSVFIGHNEWGHKQYDTTRTPAGEAVFQLKYRGDFEQVKPLAKAVVRNIVPHLPKIGLVMPAPASTARQRQPVHEVASAIAKRMEVPLFDTLIEKSAVAANAGSLKNMNTRQEKDEALKGRYLLKKTIATNGSWNVLVVDDLYHTGATMDAVCRLLAQYDKISSVYVAALTWR